MDKETRTDIGGNEMKLPEWANWLARDEDGVLYAFEKKPIKATDIGQWDLKNLGDSLIGIDETDDTFKHIKWTDEEPTEIKRGIGLGMPSLDKYNIAILNNHGHNELPKLSNPDIINEPNHYKGKHGIETIDVIRNFGSDDMVAGFYWGNAIKYMTRYRSKNGLEDLKKARKNLDWLIERVEAD
jgi:hypothetical protein